VTVRENSPADIQIGTLRARDQDAGKNAEVTFKLDDASGAGAAGAGGRACAPPEANGWLTVALTGEVRIHKSVDREQVAEITCTVVASDVGEPGEASLNSTAQVLSISALSLDFRSLLNLSLFFLKHLLKSSHFEVNYFLLLIEKILILIIRFKFS